MVHCVPPEASPSRIEAFTDTWVWDRAAEATFDDIVEAAPRTVAVTSGHVSSATMRDLTGTLNGEGARGPRWASS